MAATEYENVRIYSDDYRRALSIRAQRGIAIVESIGCALEGWDMLTREQQDELIRRRAQRQHAEPSAA